MYTPHLPDPWKSPHTGGVVMGCQLAGEGDTKADADPAPLPLVSSMNHIPKCSQLFSLYLSWDSCIGHMVLIPANYSPGWRQRLMALRSTTQTSIPSLHSTINGIFYSLSLTRATQSILILKVLTWFRGAVIRGREDWNKTITYLTSCVAWGQRQQPSLPVLLQNGDKWNTYIKGVLWGLNEILQGTLEPIIQYVPST